MSLNQAVLRPARRSDLDAVLALFEEHALLERSPFDAIAAGYGLARLFVRAGD